MALAGCHSCLEYHPGHQRATGLIPGQGTDLGCGFEPQLGPMQEATDQCFSLTLTFLFLSEMILESKKKNPSFSLRKMSNITKNTELYISL